MIPLHLFFASLAALRENLRLQLSPQMLQLNGFMPRTPSRQGLTHAMLNSIGSPSSASPVQALFPKKAPRDKARGA